MNHKKINGKQIIGYKESSHGIATFNAINPKNGNKIDPEIFEATDHEIDRACEIAMQAFIQYKMFSVQKRTNFLQNIVRQLDEIKSTILNYCHKETGLSINRLEGEYLRTINQIKMFVAYIEKGLYIDARIDTAISQRKPTEKPDIRQMQIPIGPIAVFGASNFPLAFSVAGGDTIAAFAAGCPVVFKSNPGHPITSELVSQAILKAAQITKVPEGIFSLIQGKQINTGQQLVKNKNIKAIAFTGSFKAGKSIFDTAVKRKEPIPVFAEMGSINPIFILPGAIHENAAFIAKGLFQSVVLGSGQFCTNPGLFFSIQSSDRNIFMEKLIKEFSNSLGEIVVNKNISDNYLKLTRMLSKDNNVQLIAQSGASGGYCNSTNKLFEVDFHDFIKTENLLNEIFGPVTIAVKLNLKEEVFKAAELLTGQLTISVFANENDMNNFSNLFLALREKAGRLIINGFPTGVEVCDSMHHGGPFPATTNIQNTSVGSNAIKRFLKPVCYQNFPDKLLPAELQNKNPFQLPRLLNGELTTDAIIS